MKFRFNEITPKRFTSKLVTMSVFFRLDYTCVALFNVRYYKSSFLQLLSLSTIYVFTTKVGIDMMTPTVIIGALTDKQNVGAGPLSDVTEEQMSWIGEKNPSCLV